MYYAFVHVDTTEWKKQDITGYGVKGRRSHCAACIGSSVIYFGGYNATTKEHFGDVFIVDTGVCSNHSSINCVMPTYRYMYISTNNLNFIACGCVF